MAQKFIHDVSPELTQNAQYKSISEIPSHALTSGSTIRLYPGSYDAVSSNLSNMAIIGVGDRDDVIVNGWTFSNTTLGTVTLENLTVKGTNAAAHGTAAAVEINETDSAMQLILRNVVLSNAAVGVRNHGTGVLTLDRITASGVDKACMSNANVTVNFSYLNTSSNAYGSTGGGIQTNYFVTASYSGGSNTGNTVETIKALIS